MTMQWLQSAVLAGGLAWMALVQAAPPPGESDAAVPVDEGFAPPGGSRLPPAGQPADSVLEEAPGEAVEAETQRVGGNAPGQPESRPPAQASVLDVTIDSNGRISQITHTSRTDSSVVREETAADGDLTKYLSRTKHVRVRVAKDAPLQSVVDLVQAITRSGAEVRLAADSSVSEAISEAIVDSTWPVGSADAAPAVVTSLRQRIARLDAEAARRAAEVRGAEGDRTLRERLQRVVRECFDVRQQLQRAEVDALRQRLQSVERTIAAREGSSEQIVDRRIAELLNPELRWEASVTTVAPMTEAPAGAQAHGAAEREVALMFRSAPYTEVIKLLADTLEIPVQFEREPSGVFSYSAERPVPVSQVLEILGNDLRRQGLTIIHDDGRLLVRGTEAEAPGDGRQATLPDIRVEPPAIGRTGPAAGSAETIFRSPSEFGTKLAEAASELSRVQRLQRKDLADAASVELLQRRLRLLQEEYAAQIRLLELELQAAEADLDGWQQLLEQSKTLLKLDRGTVGDVVRQRQGVERSLSRVERLRTLVDLYRKAGDLGRGDSTPAGVPKKTAEPAAEN